jgi:3D-(3,5/4)-trihydroxycyclohexane-1,2-dione acylhydrolase (decyclizing)
MNRQTRATIRLTVGQALVKYLQVQFSEQDDLQQRLVRGIFGIFGHGNVSGLGQALYEYGHDLPYFQPCNEQSMVHTAAGFAKAMRRLSTFACTASIGPGSANMLTACASATINRLPVLLFPSDYYATRFQGNVLQQIEHPVSADVSVNDCFRPLSRFFDRISRPEQLLTALPEAMRVLTDPVETGAVTISLPQDVQTEAYNYPVHFFEKRIWRIERRLPELGGIREIVSRLSKAKKPAIIAGGGVLYSRAEAELEQFARMLGIPVAETTAGRGAIGSDYPCFVGAQGVQGNPVAAQVMRDADLVICLGTRLSDFTTGSRALFQNPDVSFIHVNVCSRDAFKMGAFPVVADIRETLRALIAECEKANLQPNPTYVERVVEAKEQWKTTVRQEVLNVESSGPIGESQLVGVVFEQSKPGDIAVGASSGLLANVFKLWDTTQGRKSYLEFGFSCMGFEIPAGLGVKLAKPDREVYVFVGDGTYLMSPTELVTAVQERLKITVILAENHGYRCILAHQLHRAGRSFGNEFRYREPQSDRLEGEYLRIDYAKTAEAFGAKAWNARSLAELRRALTEARQEPGPCVIVVETSDGHPALASGIWWDVSVAEVSEDAVTQSLRQQYVQEKTELAKFYY